MHIRCHSILLICIATYACVCTNPVLAEDNTGLDKPNLFVINTDNGHFFAYRNADEMTIKGLHEWVDQYANTKVTHLFICPNAMRASFRSSSREAIWDPTDGVAPDHKWPRHARILFDKGVDPYRVWIDRCREKNLSVWLTMRMNDMHQAEDFDNFQHSSFWRENIDLWREPYHEHGSALNYAYKEVREYQLAFVKELLERYDPDGIELDWMRIPNHLTPRKAYEERFHLTAFMHEVKRLVQKWSRKRGHRIGISVRVPAHPDACAGVGMDAIKWAQQGLIDLIVATPFYFSSDFDIPFDLWKKRLQDVKRVIPVIGGIESTARPWIYGTPVGNTLSTLYGFATVGHLRGADGFYLFNWMDRTDWPIDYKNEYPQLLRTGLTPNVVGRGSRRHPVCFRDTVPDGFPSDTQLPKVTDSPLEFRLQAGTKPQSGNASIVIGLAKRNGVAESRFEARLNGKPLTLQGDFVDVKELGGDSHRAIRFECSLDILRPDYNDLSIKQLGNDLPQQIVWVELRIDIEQ